MASSRALCSRSASCLSPIHSPRQRRLSAALISNAQDASRKFNDDAFTSAFKERRSDGAPPPNAPSKPLPKRGDAFASASKERRSPRGDIPPAAPHLKPGSNPVNPRWGRQPQEADASQKMSPREPQLVMQEDGESTDESAIEIFKSVVGDKRKKGDEHLEEVRISDFSLTAILRRISKKDMAPRKRADFFFNDVWPEIRLQDRPLPKNLFVEVKSALRAVSNGLLSEPGYKQTKYGDLTQIAKAHQWLGIADVPAISGLITGLCFLMMKRPTPRTRGKPSSSVLASMSPAVAHNPELLRLWEHLTCMNRASTDVELGDDALELKIPPLEEVKRIEQRLPRSADVETALTAILNQFPANSAKQAFPALIATLTMLLHFVPRPMLSRWVPLLDATRHILTEFPLEEALIRQRFAQILQIPALSQGVLARGVASRWAETSEMLTSENPIWHASKGDHTIRRRGNMSLLRLYRDLKSAYESNNARVISGLWQEVQGYLERSDGTLAEEVRQMPEYLNYWFFVWCASKQSHMVSEVQALMKRLELEPTIKTYTSMMHGFKMSRQTDKIDLLWDTLRKSGYHLDTYLWTERISGLIELGESQRGVNTLAEMLALWKKAVEEGNTDKAAPVTITTINAAFKSLVGKDQQTAYKILQWAGNEGIKPDVFTYNILLRECSKKTGADNDVANLLTAMQDEGIAPDSATFTIILEGSCRDLQHASTAEKVKAVQKVIGEMKNANVPLNLEVWGKLLHTVAAMPQSSNAAVDYVLKECRDAGHKQISPHMVHILIKRVLGMLHPKPEMVESILLENGYTDVKTGDQRLWEEVISAYSVLGDGRRAMVVYNDLRRIGRQMSRQFANRDFLAALLRVGEVDAAKKLVAESVQSADEDLATNDRFFKHNFWHRAYEEGLIDWETAPHALKRAVDPRRLKPSGLIDEGAANM